MPKESHRGVNDLPELMRKRLQFIHLVWLVLTVALGISALIGGLADNALLAGLGLAALPGVVGAALLHSKIRAEDLIGPFLVIGWTLLAMLGIASTGAALSPLTILFAIAPLTAMNLGKPGMAAEAAIFGAFAFLATAVMVRLGLLPPANPESAYQVPAMLLAFAGLVMIGLLAWTFLKAREEEAAMPAETTTEMVTIRQDVGLPEESGLLLLDVSEFGRIRTLSGDLLGLDNVRAGGLLANLLQDEKEVSLLKPANGRTHGEVTLSNGREAAFVAEAHEAGAVLVLRDLKMRLLDGVGVLKEIKGSDNLHHIPVVVLTSSTEPSDLLRAYDAGTNAYIAKPTEFSQFLSAMKHVCEFWININQTAPQLPSAGVRTTGFGDLM